MTFTMLVSSNVEILQPKDVFGITAMMTCVFNVVKAGLYACQDFQFMAQASLWVAWREDPNIRKP